MIAKHNQGLALPTRGAYREDIQANHAQLKSTLLHTNVLQILNVEYLVESIGTHGLTSEVNIFG
jgi:hypothetical protein